MDRGKKIGIGITQCVKRHFPSGICTVMESGSGSNLFDIPAQKPSELEMLQKEYEEKTMKIQELKKQIASVKLRLGKKKEVPEEKKEAFKNFCGKYNSMREEYNALLAEKSRGNK